MFTCIFRTNSGSYEVVRGLGAFGAARIIHATDHVKVHARSNVPKWYSHGLLSLAITLTGGRAS